jgi:hypothetical protein
LMFAFIWSTWNQTCAKLESLSGYGSARWCKATTLTKLQPGLLVVN